MDEMTAFEQQLAAELGDMAGPGRRIDGMVMVRTVSTQSPKWSFQSMFSATKFVVAGAIVALFGGFLLAGVLTQPSDESMLVGASPSPESSPTQARIELPADIPEDVESGTLDSPIGPARWVHLSGTADTLPGILEPVAVPGGYVSLDESRKVACPSSDPCEAPGTLWFSRDLITWTPRALPIDSGQASLTASGGSYWLTVNLHRNDDGRFDPPSLWRSSDALEWEQVDLSSVEPPPPSGFEWRTFLDGVAGHGDSVIAPITYVAMDSARFLGLPAPPGEDDAHWSGGLAAVGDGVYTVLDHYGDELDRVRIEPTDGGLQVTDPDTGAAISVVEGAGMDFIERWAAAAGERFGDWALLRIEDGHVEQVELPEAMTDGDGLALTATVDGFRAWRGDAGSLQTWTSSDGREWTLDESLGDDVGGPTSAWIGEQPVGLVDWGHGGMWERDEYWESADGIEWQAYDPPPAWGLARLGAGWVALVDGGLAYYPGGSEDMLLIDGSPEIKSSGGGGGGGEGMGRISDNTIRHSIYDNGPGERRDHWIITFDDLPTDSS